MNRDQREYVEDELRKALERHRAAVLAECSREEELSKLTEEFNQEANDRIRKDFANPARFFVTDEDKAKMGSVVMGCLLLSSVRMYLADAIPAHITLSDNEVYEVTARIKNPHPDCLNWTSRYPKSVRDLIEFHEKLYQKKYNEHQKKILKVREETQDRRKSLDERLTAEYQYAMDRIMLGEEEDILAAIEKFRKFAPVRDKA